MPESFGARLRRTREEQHIALLTIAQQTKIKMSLLEGLERDDVSHWPSGIFRRAYIRAYAQAIGLDPDAVLSDFLKVHPEPEELFESALAAALAADAARVNGGSGTRFRSLVDSALGSFAKLRRAPAAVIREEAAHKPVGSEEPSEVPSPSADLPPMASLEADRELFASTFTAPAPLQLVALESADDGGIDIEASESTAEEPATSMLEFQPIQQIEAAPPTAPEMDWAAVAWLCTELGRVNTLDDLEVLLEQAAGCLGANGLIVWVWDEKAERLKPGLAHGYSDRVLAHLPALRRESDNATAAAFRSGQPCAIDATEHTSGALAVPLLAARGPSGVLALELQDGGVRSETVRTVATIFAALLARLVDGPSAADLEAEEKARAAEAEARAAEMQARAAEMEAFKSAVRRVHARR
jgi:transcriptional regulator with XRE-family HTH domain